MAVFYTSDTHLGHMATLHPSFTDRPFRNVHHMNMVLIHRWNAMVQPGDTVYHLGDFAHEDIAPSVLRSWFGMLNGNKTLVRGNHDSDAVLNLGWADVVDVKGITTARGHHFLLHHYPPKEPKDGQFYLHGHLHRRVDQCFPVFDVGVDANNFHPWAEHDLDRRAAAWLRGRALLGGLQRSASL